MRTSFLVALLVIPSLSFAALTANQTVHQQGRKFSVDSVTVKKGEPLVFLNDDTVPHNVLSVSGRNEFDLGSQAPGTSTEVIFTEAGDVEVICAIHPRMAMTVKVTN